MSQRTYTASTAGRVSYVNKVGTRYQVRVSHANGGFTLYKDLDTIMVMKGLHVKRGDIIGLQDDAMNNVLNGACCGSGGGVAGDVGLLYYEYPGNGTKVHQDLRIFNALQVVWVRAGLIKPTDKAIDSFTFDPTEGKIHSIEVQETFEMFGVFYKPAPGTLAAMNGGLLSFEYQGQDKFTYKDSRLVGSSQVLWARAGVLKPINKDTDSYSFKKSTGVITSTELQHSYETYTVFYKPA